MGGGSKKSETIVNVPPPSAQELELLGIAANLAGEQFTATLRQQEFTEQQFAELGRQTALVRGEPTADVRFPGGITLSARLQEANFVERQLRSEINQVNQTIEKLNRSLQQLPARSAGQKLASRSIQGAQTRRNQLQQLQRQINSDLRQLEKGTLDEAKTPTPIDRLITFREKFPEHPFFQGLSAQGQQLSPVLREQQQKQIQQQVRQLRTQKGEIARAAVPEPGGFVAKTFAQAQQRAQQEADFVQRQRADLARVDQERVRAERLPAGPEKDALLAGLIRQREAVLARQGPTRARFVDVTTPGEKIELERGRKLGQRAFEFAEEGSLFARSAIQQELASLQGSPELTGRVDPETSRFINRLAQEQFALGRSDIGRATQEAISQVVQEIAPRRGFRPTDTPITAQAFQAAEEGLRQTGQLGRQIRAEALQSLLNFPLRQQELTLQQERLASQRRQFIANLGLAAPQFSQQLGQQAFQNRLLLEQQTGGFGLGLATGVPVNPAQLGLGLGQQRIQAAPTISEGPIGGGGTVSNIIGGVGAIGGVLSAVGALCWVAREVYGANNPRWKEFRMWLFSTAPIWLTKLYLIYGERIAKWISNKPRLKKVIRHMMDKALGY